MTDTSTPMEITPHWGMLHCCMKEYVFVSTFNLERSRFFCDLDGMNFYEAHEVLKHRRLMSPYLSYIKEFALGDVLEAFDRAHERLLAQVEEDIAKDPSLEMVFRHNTRSWRWQSFCIRGEETLAALKNPL